MDKDSRNREGLADARGRLEQVETLLNAPRIERKVFGRKGLR
jgi:hypothetical protein